MEMSLAEKNLFEENVGLIRYVINKKVNKAYACSIPSVDYDDLFQVGAVGLCQAAQTYDQSKGVKFSTYAVCCISNSIRIEIEKFEGKGLYDEVDTLEENELFSKNPYEEIEETLNFNQTLDYLLRNRYKSKNIQQQRAILGMLLMGYNVKDAANALGIPYKRAKALYDNIKKQLLRKHKSSFM